MNGNYVVLKSCEVCSEPILIKDGRYEIVADCSCVRRERVELKLKKFNSLSIITRNNSTDLFENADAKEQYDIDNLTNFKNYADNFKMIMQNNAGLTLAGTPGTGKTFFANCICNEIQENGHTVLSFNFSGYLRKIKNEFNTDKKSEISMEDKLLHAVHEADMLFIDDFGSEKITEWGMEKLYNLIDTRYRANKPLIITTNLTGEDFKDNLGEKLFDRVSEMTTLVTFTGQSKRKNKNKDVWHLLGGKSEN